VEPGGAIKDLNPPEVYILPNFTGYVGRRRKDTLGIADAWYSGHEEANVPSARDELERVPK
jgi:hypothetical protein